MNTITTIQQLTTHFANEKIDYHTLWNTINQLYDNQDDQDQPWEPWTPHTHPTENLATCH